MTVSKSKGMGGSAQSRELTRFAAVERSVRHSDVGEYLERHGAEQDYAGYSPSAHQVWREVLARNGQVIAAHSRSIHPSYLEGLKALDLRSSVPRVSELNERLRSTGWKIVAVDGYIPATAYASLMAESIFPVSLRMRRPEHIDFAPEPDMVHDVLGHLPMLFCAEHRDYLRELAAVASRALPNELDTAFYDSVRRMAELKSTPGSSPVAVASAESVVTSVYAQLARNASQVTCLRRIYTWSIEFGVFGTSEQPVIHGAALLSAPSELEHALGSGVALQPYSSDVVRHDHPFSDLLDRYFVARDYAHLHEVLAGYSSAQPGLAVAAVSEIRELRPEAFERARRSDA